MVYQNDRIRVTVPDSCTLSRGEILSDAMSILGHQSELTLVAQAEISEGEAVEAAVEFITYSYLSEPGNCSYNMSEFLMRWQGGHRMSAGMLRDLDAAKMYAEKRLIEDRGEVVRIGKEILEKRRAEDLGYHARKSNTNWTIEIIGDMPDQIGTCRVKK